MRISFIADVHVGNPRRLGGKVESGINWRGNLILRSLKLAVEKAKRDSDLLVVCGDLFDSSRPEPQLVAAVQRILEGMQTVVIVGNHDRVSGAPGDHALGPLEPVATVVEKTAMFRVGGVNLLCLPFRKEAVETWFGSEVAVNSGADVIAAHFGVSDHDTPVWLLDSPDSITVGQAYKVLAAGGGQKSLFVGNWHESRDWRNSVEQVPSICQVGALVPTGWDNPGGAYGGFVVYDSETRRYVRHTITGPRFRTVTSSEELFALLEHSPFQSDDLTFVRATVDPADLPAAVGVVKEHEAEDRVEVVADGTMAEVAAREAAQAATSAETLEEAIVAYVGGMELRKGVLGTDVINLAKDFLRP